MDATAETNLDQRMPRACMVQLKCTAGGAGLVTARLSSIERLAKDSSPAAIVVFRMRKDGTPVAGYLIHLLGDELARVLKRLRAAELKERKDVNHMTISFDYRKGVRFDPDAEGLRDALSSICPGDVAAYSNEKHRQLATLGYSGISLEADVQVWIESPDHLTNMLCGLVPLKPIKIEAYDRRFDMRLPYRGSLFDGIEEFTITPLPVGPCAVIVRAGPLRPAALFRCEAFAPLIEGGPTLVIRHPCITVLFRDYGLQFESVGNFDNVRHSLENWIQFLRGLSYLADGKATIELEFHGTRTPTVPAPELDGPYQEQLPRLLDFVERWGRLLESAGISPTVEFSIADIWAAYPVQAVLDMAFNPKTLARLEFDAVAIVRDTTSLHALYFDSMEFAGVRVSFAIKVGLERTAGTPDAFASTGFELLEVCPAVQDLDAFGSRIAAENNIQVLMSPGMVDMDGK
ncbi:hypothetical protein CHU95_03575 [Niveispirillum lacus]|uniref:Uncharacterized protein n=2 Tax=Niveispirillum lacus TaxID=1981099 RepID=A0A255Z8A7_9PROT|nr:hypothetical protein CHU95_03575 [Niveispirillum lacus]